MNKKMESSLKRIKASSVSKNITSKSDLHKKTEENNHEVG